MKIYQHLFLSLFISFTFSNVYTQCIPINDLIFYGTQSNQSLSTINIDGVSNDQVIVDGSASMIRRIRIDSEAGLLFWTSGITNSIYKCNIDGSNQIEIVSGLGNPNTLVLDTENQTIYFGESSTNNLRKIDYDGTNLSTVISGAGLIQGLDIDLLGGNLYWTDYFSGRVYKSNIDGSNTTLLADVGSLAFDLVLNNTKEKLFISVRGDNSIKCINTDGTNINTIYNTTTNIGALTIDYDNKRLFVLSNNNVLTSLDYDGSNIDNFYLANSIVAGIAYGSCPLEKSDILTSYIGNLGLNEGIENSLISKINNSLSSLTNGDCTTAINQLNALINQVEALRGKKLTDNEADYINNLVQEMIDAINDDLDCNTVLRTGYYNQVGNNLGLVNIEVNSSNFEIYPNPSTEISTIEIGLKTEQLTEIQMFNVHGQIVSIIQPTSILGVGLHKIDIITSDLKSGLYVIQIKIGKQLTVRTLSVMN